MNGAVCARCSLFKCLSFLCGFVSFVTDERSGCAEGEKSEKKRRAGGARTGARVHSAVHSSAARAAARARAAAAPAARGRGTVKRRFYFNISYVLTWLFFCLGGPELEVGR